MARSTIKCQALGDQGYQGMIRCHSFLDLGISIRHLSVLVYEVLDVPSAVNYAVNVGKQSGTVRCTDISAKHPQHANSVRERNVCHPTNDINGEGEE